MTSDPRRDRRPTYALGMTTRQHVFPQAGDDLAAIARELPGVDGAEQQLLSWNLHLAARRAASECCPSDVVFTEPPPAR